MVDKYKIVFGDGVVDKAKIVVTTVNGEHYEDLLDRKSEGMLTV